MRSELETGKGGGGGGVFQRSIEQNSGWWGLTLEVQASTSAAPTSRSRTWEPLQYSNITHNLIACSLSFSFVNVSTLGLNNC